MFDVRGRVGSCSGEKRFVVCKKVCFLGVSNLYVYVLIVCMYPSRSNVTTYIE